MNEIEIDPTTKIIFPFTANKSSIGRYTYLSRNCMLYNTTIGSFCSIGPNLICGWGVHPIDTISTHPMFYSTKKQNGITLSSVDKIEEHKCIKIGNDVFIGMNVTILDGVNIGDGAVIGAGSIVSKDIPAYAVAFGNPIKIIKYRFDKDIIDALIKIQWWNFDLNKLKEVEKYFFDVNDFIIKNKI
ncbi:CatB-related O-acetyltransferase [Bacteroides sedimenti]